MDAKQRAEMDAAVDIRRQTYEEAYGADRVSAYKDLLDAELDVLRVEEEQKKAQTDLAAKVEIDGSVNLQERLLAIEQEYADKRANASAAAAKKKMDVNITAAREEAQKVVDAIAAGAQQELAVTAQKYLDGEMSAQEYEKAKADITKKAGRDTLEYQIKALDAMLAKEGLSAKERADIEKNLQAYKRQLLDADVEEYRAAADKKEEIEKELTEKRQELASALGEFAIEMLNMQFEQKIEKMEAEKEAEQERYDAELERIENEAISDEEKEARKRSAAAVTEQNQKAIDERIRQEKTKQAEANKAAAIIEAIMAAAMAQLKIWAEVPKVDWGVSTIVLSAMAAGLSAMQIGIIASQPIHKFAKGRRGGRDTLAIVGEGGQSEVIVTPSGGAYVTLDEPTLVHLGEGTSVVPSVTEWYNDPAVLGAVLMDMGAIARQHSQNADRSGDYFADFAKMIDRQDKLIAQQKQTAAELKDAINRQSYAQAKRTAHSIYTTIKSAGGDTAIENLKTYK